MKYENIIKECEKQQDQKDFERRIDEWLSQFEEDERPLMIDLLMHYTYYSERSLKVEASRLFERFMSECKEDFIVVPIQREYGVNFSDFFYTMFWMQNNIKSRAEKNIFDLARNSSLQHIEVIAIVDDYSGSAKSFMDFHRNLIETNEALKTKVFYFLTVASSSFSQLAINKYAEENGYIINLISLQTQDKAFENDYIYKRIESEIKRRQYEKICQKYSVQSNYILGFKAVEALISFSYNTPNNTLGIFWHDSQKFKHLFKRYKSQETTLKRLQKKVQQYKAIKKTKPAIMNVEDTKLNIFILYCTGKGRKYSIIEACNELGLSKDQLDNLLTESINKGYITIEQGFPEATQKTMDVIFKSRFAEFFKLLEGEALSLSAEHIPSVDQNKDSYIPIKFNNRR